MRSLHNVPVPYAGMTRIRFDGSVRAPLSPNGPPDGYFNARFFLLRSKARCLGTIDRTGFYRPQRQNLSRKKMVISILVGLSPDALRVLVQHRSTQRRLPRGRADEERLLAYMTELTRQYVGMAMTRKSVFRLSFRHERIECHS